jgi:hypothetical protein
MVERRYLPLLAVVFDELRDLFRPAKDILGCYMLFDFSYDYFETTDFGRVHFAEIICYLDDI